MKFKDFLGTKEISEAQFSEKSAEEMAGLYNEYNEKTREELSAAIEAKASKEDIDSLKKSLEENQVEQMKALNATLKEYGVSIKKLSKGVAGAASEVVNSVKKGLMDNIDSLIEMKDNKSTNISFKPVGPMLISSNVSGGNVPVEQRLSGLNELPSRTVRLLDIVTRGTAESNVISWVYQANKEGAAGGTAEGELKNQIDFDLVVDSETVNKRTSLIKISEEMLGDISFMESEINNELMRELLKDVESQVYEGDGTGTNLNGIKTVASAFAAGTFAGGVDNANAADVLTVAANQIKIGDFVAPNFILMHPSDVTNLKLIKTSSTDRRYVDRLAMIAGQMSLDGMPIIESTLVTQDEYLIGNFDLAPVYDKGSIRIEVGRDSDDFTKNMVTVLAEWRGLNLVKNNDRGAFVTGTFSVDAAALETP